MRILASALWGGSGPGAGGPPRQGCVKVSCVHSEPARQLKLIRAPCPFFSPYFFFFLFLLQAPWTAPVRDEGTSEGPTPPSSSTAASREANGSRRSLEGFTQTRRGMPLMCTLFFFVLLTCARIFFAAAEMLFEEQAATYGWLGVPGRGNSNHPSLLPSDEGKVLRPDTKGCLHRKCTRFIT